jgi:hypothetical protein
MVSTKASSQCGKFQSGQDLMAVNRRHGRRVMLISVSSCGLSPRYLESSP